MDNIFEDNSDRNAHKDPKSGKESKGKDKARDSTSETSSCTDSTSSSDCESTKTSSTSDCDDSLSHRGSERSCRSIHNISPTLNPHEQFLSPPRTSSSKTSQPKVQHCPKNVDLALQPEEASGDENMFPSPIQDLALELVSIEKMIEEGIPAPEITAHLVKYYIN